MKILKGSLAIAAVLFSGLLFELFGGISYGAQGTNGVLNLMSMIMSTIYFLLLLLFSVWLGYKKWTPCFVAFGLVFAVVGVMGVMGYLGYGFLLGGLSSVYFLCITPFSAIIETIARSWHMYYAIDRIMLIVPLVVYFLAMVSYIAGTVLRAHKRALYYSLMRLDSRYEYRIPLEDAIQEEHSA